MVKSILIFIFSLTVASVTAQQTIVSGQTGTLKDPTSETTVEYTATLSGAAHMVTWGAREYCGINWTGIECPTMGNTTEEGVVTYTFSKPIQAIDLFLCHVNMNGSVAPETMEIRPNHGTIHMEIDNGTCARWTIQGNVITSPSVEGGINVIVHITCDTAFNILTISSKNNDENGGAGTAFIENSAQAYLTSTPFTIPPPSVKNKPQGKKQK